VTGRRAVPLRQVAHGRTGDKGNRCNISVIGYVPDVFPYLVEQVTAERVAARFSYRGPIVVARYELPLLSALNFVLDGVLEGGVNRSLNLDGHGKALAFHLLGLTVEVPAGLVREASS
jgi:hypothetical protein